MRDSQSTELAETKALLRAGDVTAARQKLRQLRHNPEARRLLAELEATAPAETATLKVPRIVYVALFVCLLLTIPFFVGADLDGSSEEQLPATLFLPTSNQPVGPGGAQTATIDALDIMERATYVASTQEANRYAAEATVTRQALLDATATMAAILNSSH